MKPYLAFFPLLFLLGAGVNAQTYLFNQTVNQTFVLQPNQSIIDNFSNNTIVGNFSINSNVQFKYSACYGIYGQARTFCDANPLNSPLLSFSNQLYNVSCQAPAFPVINQNIQLIADSANSSYLNPDYGLTVLCNTNPTSPPKLNLSINLNLNESYRLDVYNVSAYCNGNPVIVQTPVNATTCSELIDGQVAKKVDERLLEIANATNNSLLYANVTGQFCYTVAPVNSSACGLTIKTAAGDNICIDDIKQICTIDEIAGDWRGCFNRFVTDERKTVVEKSKYIEKLEKDVKDLQDSNILLKSGSDNSKANYVAFFWLIIGGLAVYVTIKILNARDNFPKEGLPPITDGEIKK